MKAKESANGTMKEFLATTPGPDAVVTKVRELATSSQLMLKECAYICVASMFDTEIVSGGQVAKNASILQALVATDATKFMARHLIGAVEDFCGSRVQTHKKFFPIILKQLYDEDVLEEEVILDWAKQGVTYEFSPQSMNGEQIKELRTLAEPFINWLNEAEEDDDEE
jgi:translation initiation factor 5